MKHNSRDCPGTTVLSKIWFSSFFRPPLHLSYENKNMPEGPDEKTEVSSYFSISYFSNIITFSEL